MEPGSIGQLLGNAGSISDKISFMVSSCLQSAELAQIEVKLAAVTYRMSPFDVT